MSARTSWSRLTSESCPTRENTSFTLDSPVRWDTVYLKTKKYKGNRTRSCLSHHIKLVQYTILDKALAFVFWNTWPPPNLIVDYIKLTRLCHFGFKSTYTKTSYLLLTIYVSSTGTFVVLATSQHHLSHGCMSCWSVCPHTFLWVYEEEETPWKCLTIVWSSLKTSFRSPSTSFSNSKKTSEVLYLTLVLSLNNKQKTL